MSTDVDEVSYISEPVCLSVRVRVRVILWNDPLTLSYFLILWYAYKSLAPGADVDTSFRVKDLDVHAFCIETHTSTESCSVFVRGVPTRQTAVDLAPPPILRFPSYIYTLQTNAEEFIKCFVHIFNSFISMALS